MQGDVPFINLEYFFTKIYDFLVYIKNVVLTGSFSASSGSSQYADSFASAGSWIVTILTFLFIIFVIWAIYIRVRIYEIDQSLEGSYKGHFIKPENRSVKINTRWQGIAQHFASANPNDWRIAILEADILLDELVTSLGYTGDGLGEKLTSIRVNDFPTLQSAWEAHKVRNIIAHQGASYHLTDHQKEVTRKHFENVFRSAGVI